MLQTIDKTKPVVTVARHFEAPPERVFDAWLDAKAAGKWLFANPGQILQHAEIDARVGGRFEFHNLRGDELYKNFGTYVEITRPKRLVFSFGTSSLEGSSLVTIDFKPDGKGTWLSLTHELDPNWDVMAASVRGGWTGILEGLARETGEPGNGHTLIIHRDFNAPRLLVWKAWTEKEHIMRWLCPAGFKVMFAEGNLSVGGNWRSGMRSPDGKDYIAGGTYLEIDPPARLVFTHIWESNDLEPRANTTITVTLEEKDGKTHMTFVHAGLGNEESALSHKWGWSGAFDNLAAFITAQ
jgi:uncharacterized protein YndB with AHSA1/START domain